MQCDLLAERKCCAIEGVSACRAGREWPPWAACNASTCGSGGAPYPFMSTGGGGGMTVFGWGPEVMGDDATRGA